MEPLPPTAPLPPFWDAVRRRHPEVDVVLLPGREPVGPPGDDVDDQAVRAAVRRVTTAAAALVADLVTEPPAAARIGFGPAAGTVVPRVRLTGHREDGLATLDRLRERLGEQGWSVRRPAGGVARLVGRRDDLHLRASYAERTGSFLLEVCTDPMPVGIVRARELAGR